MTKANDDGASDANNELSRIVSRACERWEISPESFGGLAVLISANEKGEADGAAIVVRCREETKGEILIRCRTPIGERYALLEPLTQDMNFIAAHVGIIDQVLVGSQYELRGRFVVLPANEVDSREQK